MDNETRKMFELILDKLDNMDLRLNSMDLRLNSMDSRLNSMDSQLNTIYSRLNNMESRQDEIYQVVKAIEHASQVHRAEIDNVKVRTDYLEGTLNDIGKVINSRRAVK